MKLFFDTETTGKADFNSAPYASHQPRLVQLAALLTTDSGEEVACLNTIIRPDGFTIPDEAAEIHGIDTETAIRRGVWIDSALSMFDGFSSKADVLVAHNVAFDSLIIDGEFARIRQISPIGNSSLFCTMHAMTPVCAIPNPHGYDSFKWPKLQEAYKHAFGKEFVGAHNAMADVRACAAIYFWLDQGGSK